MSLSAMSLGDWFSVNRKGVTGGGGFVYAPKGMAVSGFGCKRCLAILSHILLCTNTSFFDMVHSNYLQVPDYQMKCS